MSMLAILDIVVTLSFLYLMLSLACMVLQEFIAGINNSRGNLLFESIGTLFGDPKLRHAGKAILDHPLVGGLVPPGWGMQREGSLQKLLTQVMPFLGTRRPSHIEPELFASVVGDLARRDGSFNGGPTHPAVEALLAESANDPERFRVKVAAWYKTATERQSALYRRKAQRWVFFYGFGLALLLNVDTIAIARYVWTGGDAGKRAELLTHIVNTYETNKALFGCALKYAEQPCVPQQSSENQQAEADKQKAADAIRNSLQKIEDDKLLPIGWSSDDGCAILKASLGKIVAWTCAGEAAKLPNGKAVDGATWLGWFLTALAVSLGAQFWFDALGKVIALRPAGKKT